MLTPAERQELARRHADDLARMRQSLAAAGRHAEDDDIVVVWATYSARLCAGWLALPNDDGALLPILLKYLPTHWQAATLGAEGNDEGVLPLPEKLLAQAGWKNGDMLDASVNEAGELLLRRKDRTSP